MPAPEDPNNRQFLATPSFWKQFDKLDPRQQEVARLKLKVFREDPFHGSLGTHRINRLSAIYKRSIYSVRLEGDLRAPFYVEGDVVVSIAIVSHDVYG